MSTSEAMTAALPASDHAQNAAADDGRDRHQLKIAFFGHDANESTIRKRVKALQAAGATVTGLMFSRRRNGNVKPPGWTNVDLGVTEDGYYGRRVVQLITAFGKLWRHRKYLRDADIIYARNIDMLLMACIAKLMAASKAPLVYEALDVHPAMTKDAALGRVLRFIERRLLASSALLVVSSPTFIEKYFAASQGYDGPWFLLENKVLVEDDTTGAASGPAASDPPPWIIGWFGVIRCQRSLAILQRLASAMPQRLAIHIRGIPSERDGITKERLDEICAANKNISYFGTYRSPDDLAGMYAAVHLTWAVDFSASGANSDWLIPNRLYEGGLYGVPAIARGSTATGTIVDHDERGWSFDEPFEENVAKFLRDLDVMTYEKARETLSKRDRSAFVDLSDTAALVTELRRLAHEAPVPTQGTVKR